MRKWKELGVIPGFFVGEVTECWVISGSFQQWAEEAIKRSSYKQTVRVGGIGFKHLHLEIAGIWDNSLHFFLQFASNNCFEWVSNHYLLHLQYSL